MKRILLQTGSQPTVVEADIEGMGNSSSEDEGEDMMLDGASASLHSSATIRAPRKGSYERGHHVRSSHHHPGVGGGLQQLRDDLWRQCYRFVNDNRQLVLRSFIAAAAFVLFVLLIVYWPYLNSYWMVPQWRRVEAGWRSFRGDVEHLRREKEMMARVAFDKRRLLRSPHACESLAGGPAEHAKKRAWLTAVANDNYVTPTLAMARTLDEFSCVKTKIALVPDDLSLVSETTRDLLRRAGFEVQVKPSLDCMSAHGSGASEIALYPGEYMRLYGWNMTEYDRIVYVDCDIMLLDNVDELFELPLQDDQMGAAYYEEPNIVDTGENSGLLVIKPREQEFVDLLAEWKALFPTAGCVADQPFLWLFYHQPGRSINFLPYSFNVRKRVYHPMRVWHFAGPARLGYKPWIYPHTPAESYDRPIVAFIDVVALWWHFLYGAVKSYGLEQNPWWQKEHERLMSIRLQVEESRNFPPLRDEIKR